MSAERVNRTTAERTWTERVSRILYRYRTRAQKGPRFHDLRHSAATILLATGVPERVEMEVLGHSTLAMEARPARAARLTVAAAERMDRVMGR